MVQLEIRTPVVIERAPVRSTQSSLSIIEAAYDLQASDDAWLAALLRELQPFIDSGLGLYGHYYDFVPDGSLLRIGSPTLLGCAPGLETTLNQAAQVLEPEHVRLAYSAPPCQSFSQWFESLGVAHGSLEMTRVLERERGIADLLLVNAWLGENKGACFVAPLASVRRFPARTGTTLARAARHVAAALRLRRAVRRSHDRVSLDAEAVLDECGTVLHAEGEAKGQLERELLATSARTLFGAQQRWRDSEPEQVESLWNALVDGRWSLVESFDRDGKRFMLARRNPLELDEPSALSLAERQVAALFSRGHSTKLVAYELGLSSSTVSSILQRALRKLHVRSRTELVTLFKPK